MDACDFSSPDFLSSLNFLLLCQIFDYEQYTYCIHWKTKLNINMLMQHCPLAEIHSSTSCNLPLTTKLLLHVFIVRFHCYMVLFPIKRGILLTTTSNFIFAATFCWQSISKTMWLNA